MAKKKPVINLSEQNLSFTENNQTYRLIDFNPNTMELSVVITFNDQKRKEKLPFAHLPKDLKKAIRPN